jgi:hypothetical protein
MAKPKPKQESVIVYTRLDRDTYEALADKAKFERRPMSTMLAIIAEEYFWNDDHTPKAKVSD